MKQTPKRSTKSKVEYTAKSKAKERSRSNTKSRRKILKFKEEAVSTPEPINFSSMNQEEDKEEDIPESRRGQRRHFIFPDDSPMQVDGEEIFADASQFCGPDWMNKVDEDILPYTNSQEDDLGLSVRGIRLHPELFIEINNGQHTEGMKGSSPRFDRALQPPSPISIGALSPLNIPGRSLDFASSPTMHYASTERVHEAPNELPQ
eukprot:TRINITY_DN3396_c0_g7_i1.p3 TRINITY_DN3396_c0_g7~~TRINITY_DN3396_c0_g7_i1.p3  ORF type:complete len:205 (+),score=41.55 TRINITY_DN3396_c0_g7_i1:369-983(+)